MKWLCGCDQEPTRLEVLWEWRRGADIGHKRGRFVSYRCRIGCEDCVPFEEGPLGRFQYFPVKLAAPTKQALVPQVVGQVLKAGPRGFLPKTDVQGALRNVYKGSG